jgi:tetratricopeptide (TPR) repeat protein
VLLEETGNRQQAQEHLMEAARIAPRIPLPQTLLGILLVRDGAPERAEACFRKALQADPNCVDALLQLSWIKADSKQPELRDPLEAIKLADRACELTQRQDPGALLVLAVADHAAGRREEAVQLAETALSLARSAGNQPVADAIQKRLTEWLRRP